MSDSSDLKLPVPGWVLLLAVAAIAAVLLVGAWINQRRRATQLAAIESADCSVTIPQATADRLQALTAATRIRRKRARDLVEAVEDLYPDARAVTVFYERGDRLWFVSDWRGPSPNGRRELPPAWNEWAEVSEPGFCQGTIADDSFIVLRTIASEPGRRIAVMTKRHLSG